MNIKRIHTKSRYESVFVIILPYFDTVCIGIEIDVHNRAI